jgi:hypothetical protein
MFTSLGGIGAPISAARMVVATGQTLLSNFGMFSTGLVAGQRRAFQTTIDLNLADNGDQFLFQRGSIHSVAPLSDTW